MHAMAAALPRPTQPVGSFCHHGPRGTQVVAFRVRPGRRCMYKLAGGTEAWSARAEPRARRS